MNQRNKFLALTVAAAAVWSAQPLVASAKEGDWLIRGGVGVVDPKSDNLTLNPTQYPGVPGEIQVDTGVSATIEGTYMFRDHWGVELLASTPFSHDVKLQAADGTETKIADVKHLPPTLSLQYHFNPEGTWRPYIGAGLNYTMIFDESTKGPLAGSSLRMDNSFGLAGQIGMDVGITENFFVNAAVRYIDIDSDAELDGFDIGTVSIDPFVYQLQVGYKFGRPAPVVAAAAPVVAAAPPPPPPPPPPADTDGDGVVDTADLCPDTPKGDRVGPQGCSCDVTRQVQFALNSADLTAEGKKTLDELAETLTKLKFVAGTVVGHTDSSGSDAYNQKLSERRAKTVADYLQAKGIASGRLAVSGAGESQPIADNKTKEGRALNRRVVLKRTDCDKQ
jgi:outer membrane protein